MVMDATIPIDPLLQLIGQYAKSELTREMLSIPWFSRAGDFEVSRWRLTECGDMYPAHINCGYLIFPPTDTETARLTAAGITLEFEKARWALKTKSAEVAL